MFCKLFIRCRALVTGYKERSCWPKACKEKHIKTSALGRIPGESGFPATPRRVILMLFISYPPGSRRIIRHLSRREPLRQSPNLRVLYNALP